MTSILERALAAEEQLESRDAIIAELEARLKAIVGGDPHAKMAAQAWVRRAELAEVLLRELEAWATAWPTIQLPDGWLARCRAQLHTLDIVGRGDIDGETYVAHARGGCSEHGAPAMGCQACQREVERGGGAAMWEVVDAEGKPIVLTSGDSLVLKDVYRSISSK